MSFNNGYVYFNASGFNRLNTEEDSVEQIYEKRVDAVNFAGDSILFCRNRSLYKMNADGLKRIQKLPGKTDGIYRLDTEGRMIKENL